MDNLHRQESWLGGSLSAPRVRSGQLIALPFAAHFASSTLTTSSGAAANNISNTSSLVAPQPSPELEDVFAKMRKHLENGKWGPEDSNALLSLLDEGRFNFCLLCCLKDPAGLLKLIRHNKALGLILGLSLFCCRMVFQK